VGLYFNGKNLAVRNTCKTSDFATSILRINTSESDTVRSDVPTRRVDVALIRTAKFCHSWLSK